MFFKRLTAFLSKKSKDTSQRKATSEKPSQEQPFFVEKSTEKIYAVGQTDTGLVRESNQDRFLIDTDTGLFIVADGMGGHKAGEVASQMAVEHVSRFIKERSNKNRDPLSTSGKIANENLQSILEQIFKETNTAVYQAWQKRPEYTRMGTTLIVAWVVQQKCYLGHVGDVRGYLLRDGHLEQLTRDHTKVAKMVESGQISAEEARHHPLRNRIQRSIGPHSEVLPDVTTFDLKSHDRLLLCSDGLWGMVEDSEIASLLGDQDNIKDACRNLVDRVLANGGEDNVTVVILEII